MSKSQTASKAASTHATTKRASQLVKEAAKNMCPRGKSEWCVVCFVADCRDSNLYMQNFSTKRQLANNIVSTQNSSLHIFCEFIFVFPLEMTFSFFPFSSKWDSFSRDANHAKGKICCALASSAIFSRHCLAQSTALTMRMRRRQQSVLPSSPFRQYLVSWFSFSCKTTFLASFNRLK